MSIFYEIEFAKYILPYHNIDEFANKKDYKKHECSLLLTEEAASQFLSENEKSVPDFKDTIMHAFDIMKKDEEDYQWR